jgi:hypothetical protein
MRIYRVLIHVICATALVALLAGCSSGGGSGHPTASSADSPSSNATGTLSLTLEGPSSVGKIPDGTAFFNVTVTLDGVVVAFQNDIAAPPPGGSTDVDLVVPANVILLVTVDAYDANHALLGSTQSTATVPAGGVSSSVAVAFTSASPTPTPSPTPNGSAELVFINPPSGTLPAFGFLPDFQVIARRGGTIDTTVNGTVQLTYVTAVGNQPSQVTQMTAGVAQFTHVYAPPFIGSYTLLADMSGFAQAQAPFTVALRPPLFASTPLAYAPGGSIVDFRITKSRNGPSVVGVRKNPSPELDTVLLNGSTFTTVATDISATVSPNVSQIFDVHPASSGGTEDVVIFDRGTSPPSSVHYFKSNPDGTYAADVATTLTNMGSSTGGYAAVADFNNDGIPDIAVDEQLGNGLFVYYGQSDGTVSAGPQVAISGMSFGGVMAAGDFDQDGNVDIVVADGSSAMAYVVAGPTFAGAPVALTLSARADDLNLGNPAGRPTAIYVADNQVEAFPNQSTAGQIAFSSAHTAVTGGLLFTVLAVDLRGALDDDLLTSDSPGMDVLLYGSAGNGAFNQLFTFPGEGEKVRAGDVNGDAIPDVLTLQFGSPNDTISVFPHL